MRYAASYGMVACTVIHLFAGAAVAGPRIGGDYAIPTDGMDAGGGKTTSGDYANNGCVGGIGQLTSAGVYMARSGFPGQLYDWTDELAVGLAPATLNEGESRQLSVQVVADDETQVGLDPTGVLWTKSGPMTVGTNGMATGGVVYQDTSATATATFGSATGQLALTVLDTVDDNFGSYAGDGLSDGWQFQYFGADSADAAPDSDPDGDGQDNEFEFIAGLHPANPLSRFLVSVAPVPGQPGQQQIIFEPRYASRSYRILTSGDLTPGSWIPLDGVSISDDGNQRTVTDLNAAGTKKFYKVEIQKP